MEVIMTAIGGIKRHIEPPKSPGKQKKARFNDPQKKPCLSDVAKENVAKNMIPCLEIKDISQLCQTSRTQRQNVQLAEIIAKRQIKSLSEEIKTLIEKSEIVGIQLPNGRNSIEQLRFLTDFKDNLTNAITILTANNITDINARDEDGDTPLHDAAWGGDTKVAQALIAVGGNLNGRNDEQMSPLMIAAKESNTDLIKVLLNAGADINAGDGTEWTALHWAACWGNSNSVRTLLMYGANPNARDNEGGTPLHNAAMKCKKESVEALIECWADVHAININGHPPLDVANIWEPHHSKENYKKVVEILKAAMENQNTSSFAGDDEALGLPKEPDAIDHLLRLF